MQKNRSMLISKSRKSSFKRVLKVFSMVVMITMLFFAIDTFRKFNTLDESDTLSKHIHSGEYLDSSLNDLIKKEKLKYSPKTSGNILHLFVLINQMFSNEKKWS